MTPTPANDTGIAGDQNTNESQPSFIGQIYVPFPGSVSGDQVLVQFGGLHGGSTTLTVGGTTQPGATTGRGYSGSYDVLTTTDSTGTFTVTAPSALPEGFQSAVAVVIGQADQPPLPGLTRWPPTASASTRPPLRSPRPRSPRAAHPCPCPTPGSPTSRTSPLSSTLSLTVVDPINPQSGPFATPSTVAVPAPWTRPPRRTSATTR